MAEQLRTFLTDRGDRGLRLDRVLQRRLADLPELSRSELQRWLAAGRVRVAGRRVCRASQRLQLRQAVEVSLPAAWAGRPPIEPEPLPLAVLWEDEHLLAVAKPAGLVAHPTLGHRHGTLLNALLWRAHAWPEGQRPRLVHRLDRGTSGVLLVAKTRAAAGACGRLFSERLVTKEYLAFVSGRPRRGEGAVVATIRREAQRPQRRLADPTGPRPDCTEYRVLDSAAAGALGRVSLLLCRPHSGRTHQIRAHLEHLGVPLLGDPLYGSSRDAAVALPRPALHAWRLKLEHPLGGGPLELTAPLPADLAELARRAGLSPSASAAVASAAPVPWHCPRLVR